MPLFHIILVLIVIGVVLMLVNQYIPMDPTIKKILNIAVVVFVCLWLLRVSGLLGELSSFRVGP